MRDDFGEREVGCIDVEVAADNMEVRSQSAEKVVSATVSEVP